MPFKHTITRAFAESRHNYSGGKPQHDSQLLLLGLMLQLQLLSPPADVATVASDFMYTQAAVASPAVICVCSCRCVTMSCLLRVLAVL